MVLPTPPPQSIYYFVIRIISPNLPVLWIGSKFKCGIEHFNLLLFFIQIIMRYNLTLFWACLYFLKNYFILFYRTIPIYQKQIFLPLLSQWYVLLVLNLSPETETNGMKSDRVDYHGFHKCFPKNLQSC